MGGRRERNRQRDSRRTVQGATEAAHLHPGRLAMGTFAGLGAYRRPGCSGQCLRLIRRRRRVGRYHHPGDRLPLRHRSAQPDGTLLCKPDFLHDRDRTFRCTPHRGGKEPEHVEDCAGCPAQPVGGSGWQVRGRHDPLRCLLVGGVPEQHLIRRHRHGFFAHQLHR